MDVLHSQNNLKSSVVEILLRGNGSHLEKQEEDELLLKRLPPLVGDQGEEVAGLTKLHHLINNPMISTCFASAHHVDTACLCE